MYVCMCLHEYVHTCMCVSPISQNVKETLFKEKEPEERGQKRALDPLDLDLQMFVRCQACYVVPGF